MSTSNRISKAERLGRWLGGMWRGYARRERQAAAWLAAQGVPAGGTVALLWVVKLGVLAMLFYAVFWLALLVAFAIAAAWVARNYDVGEEEQAQTEWRYGHAGYGLYTSDGYRVDPHDPEDEQD
jgi:hypothetical protein